MIAALLLPPLAGAFGWRAALAGAAAVCAFTGILCWLGLRDDTRGRRSEAAIGRGNARGSRLAGTGPIVDRVRAILRNTGVRRTTEASMLLVIAQFCYQGYLALYLVDRFGWSNHAAAVLLVAVHLGGVLGRLVWGALSDRRYGGRSLQWDMFPHEILPRARTFPAKRRSVVLRRTASGTDKGSG